MLSKAFIIAALVLLCSVVAEEEMPHHENKDAVHDENNGDKKPETNIGGYGGGGYGHGGAGGAGSGSGYSAGFSHGGVYGGGKICKFGCCSESYGYSHGGGGYYGCTCCGTFVEAKAYKESRAKARTKN